MSSTLQYGKDQFGKEILLKNNRYPVIMEWEKPYIEETIKTLKPFGDVLEIGFGLGYSANQIQTFSPKTHVIIESDPAVLKRAKEWAKAHPNVTIIDGFWQIELSKLGSFDVIYFDAYLPFSEQDIEHLKKETDQLRKLNEDVSSLHDSIKDVMASFKHLKFSDADLAKFQKEILSRATINKEQVDSFIETIVDQGNITQEQADSFLKAMQHASPKMVKEKEAPQTIQLLNSKRMNENFIQFIELCLENHLRKGGRLSGYAGEETAARHQPFQETILSRGDIKFSEKLFPVKVPENCPYFKGNNGLIFVIEKK